MRRLFCKTLVLVLAGLALQSNSFAHSGRTDSSGGHRNRRTGSYHYHNSGTSSSRPSYKSTPRTAYRTQARTTYRGSESTKRTNSESIADSSIESRPERREVASNEESVKSRAAEQEAEAKRLEQKLLESEVLREKEEERKKRAAEANVHAAENLLKAARKFREEDERDSMEKWLRKVISRYPDTESASEARRMLGIRFPSAERTWTDATGKYRIVAQCVGFENGNVRLKKTDSEVKEVPIDKLSSEDQQFVHELFPE